MTSNEDRNGHDQAVPVNTQQELFKLSPIAKRRIQAATEIAMDLPDNPTFLHSVLCQIGFPRSRTQARIFERRNGNASLRIKAGELWLRGNWVDQPIPYSTHPRLVLMHLCTRAKQTKDPIVEVGNSIHEFLKDIGISTGGGPRGGYTTFKRQMMALAACDVQIGFTDEHQRDHTINTHPVYEFQAWLQGDGKQIGMWPGVMELSKEFFDSIIDHSVPLDPRAVGALKDSSLALDIYAWLAHRLRRIRQPGGLFLSWQNLYDQFGQEYGGKEPVKNFSKEFLKVLKLVQVQYRDAKFEKVRGGMRFYSSPPPIPQSQIVVSLPKGQG